MVFRFGGESLLTSDKMSSELRRNGTFFLSIPPRATGIVLATGGGRMVVYPHMKRFGSISFICSTLLLSACTLTQQQQQQFPLSAEEIEARQQAARELDAALVQEQERLQKEAEQEARTREEEEKAKQAQAAAPAPTEAEKARHRAEQEILAAEKEQAHAEETASREKEDDSARPAARLFTTRGIQQAEEPAGRQEEITPTAEQQKAAQALLNRQPASAPTSEPAPEKQADKPAELKLPGSVTGGALRQHRFGPPAETLHDDDDEEQLPNSVELRGLRSPSMKGRLPLNIDGKINKN